MHWRGECSEHAWELLLDVPICMAGPLPLQMYRTWNAERSNADRLQFYWRPHRPFKFSLPRGRTCDHSGAIASTTQRLSLIRLKCVCTLTTKGTSTTGIARGDGTRHYWRMSLPLLDACIGWHGLGGPRSGRVRKRLACLISGNKPE